MTRRIAPALALFAVPLVGLVLIAAPHRAAATGLPPGTPTLTVTAPTVPLPTAIKLNLPVVITFDTVASGTAVDAVFPGLTFGGVTNNAAGALVPLPGHVYAINDPTLPRAACNPPGLLCSPVGGNVVTLNPPGQLPWIQGAQGGIQVKFATPKAWVSVMARPSLLPEALGTPNNRAYLVAYGPSGYLGEALYPYAAGTPQWGAYQTIPYTAPAGQTITSIILSTQTTQGGPPVLAEFDNLSYPQ